MSLRCVYTDLDGTLLGRGGSLFHDADGAFSMLPARGLEACHRAGVEVVVKSGRRKSSVAEDAKLMGQSAYIYEVGSALVIDGEETFLTDELQPSEGRTIFDQIGDSGAPALLLEHYSGRLEYHSPWHVNRDVSHLLRGLVDALEADRLLADSGHGDVRLVDNGTISPRSTELRLEGAPHCYHLIPRAASKARAVARHMQVRGYAPEECVAVGDSREDLGVAAVVGRFFLVANGVEKDPDIRGDVAWRENVVVTEGRNGDGFYEAVVRSLAEG